MTASHDKRITDDVFSDRIRIEQAEKFLHERLPDSPCQMRRYTSAGQWRRAVCLVYHTCELCSSHYHQSSFTNFSPIILVVLLNILPHFYDVVFTEGAAE